jgi:nucleoside-diphosphate-sugar epimerase
LAPCEFYGKTKHEAEELLFERYHEPRHLDVATFRSVMVYGPDAVGSYIDGMFNMIKNSKGPVVVPMKDTSNSYVHTYDIGRAFVHAVENDSAFVEDASELNDIAYNLADEHVVSEHDIARMIINLMDDGRKRFLLPLVPGPLLKIAASVSEFAEGFFKERTSLPKGVVLHSPYNHILDNRKFKQRTGFGYYFPTTLVGMIDVMDWYKENVWSK